MHSEATRRGARNVCRRGLFGIFPAMTITPTNEAAEPAVALSQVALQLSKALDEERKRIAEGLHDDLGQTLAAAMMRLHELRMASTDTARMSAADEIEKLIRQAIDSSRELTFDLRSPVLPGHGLAATFESMATRFSRDHGITCAVDCDVQPGQLGSVAADILYRVARELLQNVAKHAHADEARISLVIRGGRAELSVADDGRGFDTGERRQGFGLLIASERVAEIGGNFVIRSGSDGTTVTVVIPVSIDTSTS